MKIFTFAYPILPQPDRKISVFFTTSLFTEKKIVIFHHSLGRVQWGDERDNCTQLNFLSG